MVSYREAEIRNGRKQIFYPDFVQFSGQRREKVTVAKEKAALERLKRETPTGEGRGKVAQALFPKREVPSVKPIFGIGKQEV